MVRGTTSTMDEQALISSAQRGDVHAFNQLVRKYQRLAYNTAYRMLSNADSAADATQDAFTNAFRAIGKFRGGSFKAWILRIVTNACYDQLRRRQRRPEESLDDLIEIEADHTSLMADHAEQPEEYALRQEVGRTIQQGLASLPDDQRTAIILSDIQGFSYDEIAETMGVALGTVKSRISRGRSALRDFLRGQGELLPKAYRPTQ
jgi:RNA polymerase sigma factor (sigma-70 family)